MKKTLAIALVTIAACGDPAPLQELPIAQVEVSLPILVEPDPDPTSVITISVMEMAGGNLQSCEDLVLTVTFPAGRDFDEEKEREVTATARENLIGVLTSSNEGMQIMPEGTCASQFAGRLAYARCTIRKGNELDFGRLDAVGVKAIYDLDSVYGNDRSMSNCILDGGEWQAVPERSAEVRSAKRRAAAHELQSVSRELQRMRRNR